MGFIADNLASGEQVVFGTKRYFPFTSIMFVLILMFLAAPHGLIGKMCALGIAVGIVTTIARYRASELVITNKRVMIKTGALSTRTIELNLSKVESVIVDQGFLGKRLGYGNITIIGSGGTREQFKEIAKPLEFRKAVHEAIDARVGQVAAV